MERGRWSRSSRLSRSTSSSHLTRRRLKSRSVHALLRSATGHRSDQRAVWDEVDRKSARHGLASKAGALHEARLALADKLEKFLSLAENLPDDAHGVIVSIAGRAVAFELLPDRRTFLRAAGRLVSGYALKSLEHDRTSGSPEEDPEDLVRRLSAAIVEEHAAVGGGRDLRFEGYGISGYALASGGRLLHLAALPDLYRESPPRPGHGAVRQA